MKNDTILIGASLLIIIVIMILWANYEFNERPSLASKCQDICRIENMTLHMSNYPECICAPQKTYYEASELKTYYLRLNP